MGGGGEAAVDYQDVSEDMTMPSGGPEGLDMMSQEGAMTAGGVGGLTPETAGEFANPNALVG